MAGKEQKRTGGGEEGGRKGAQSSETPTEGKRGRPVRALSWMRERAASDGTLVKYERKREQAETDEGGERGEKKRRAEERAFNKSGLTPKALEKIKTGDPGDEMDTGRQKEDIEERREKKEGEEEWMKKAITELTAGIKGMLEEMKRMREGMELGRKEAREELEKIREEMKEID